MRTRPLVQLLKQRGLPFEILGRGGIPPQSQATMVRQTSHGPTDGYTLFKVEPYWVLEFVDTGYICRVLEECPGEPEIVAAFESIMNYQTNAGIPVFAYQHDEIERLLPNRTHYQDLEARPTGGADLLGHTRLLGEHMSSQSHAGLATFFGATYALAPWSGVDIALVGVPSDAGLSQRTGARHGPREVRQHSRQIFYYNPLLKMSPFRDSRVADVGDAILEHNYHIDQVLNDIEGYYRLLKDAHIIPISCGGDHSVTYPILRALASQAPVGLIHLDSHYDTAGPMGGSHLHHGSPFLLATEQGLIDPHKTVHVGVRDPAHELEIEFIERHGMHVIDIDRFHDLGIAGTVAECRRIVGDGPVYLSLDVDVLDPAFAPGTGTPVPGGLTTYECKRFLHGLKGINLRGADVVEVSPLYDTTHVTALTAAQLMFELLCLASIARRQNPRPGR